MDSKVALVQPISLNGTAIQIAATNAANAARDEAPPTPGQKKPAGEMRRRRRRRGNAAKLAVDNLVDEGDDFIQQHTPPYTPLRGNFGEIPHLEVQSATPRVESWTDEPEPEDRAQAETLEAIALRARERLASRIQAYWEENKKVAEAASRIQNAYATHMETQLGTIVSTLQAHLSSAIDSKLGNLKQTWQDELSETLSSLDIPQVPQHPHGVDPKLVKTARINALESETQRLMTMMIETQQKALETQRLVPVGELMDALKQLRAQGQRNEESLQSLFNLKEQQMIEIKELKEVMTRAGLLSPSSASNKAASAVGSPSRGRNLDDGKENSPPPLHSPYSSPLRSKHSPVGSADSSLRI